MSFLCVFAMNKFIVFPANFFVTFSTAVLNFLSCSIFTFTMIAVSTLLCQVFFCAEEDAKYLQEILHNNCKYFF